MGLVSVIIPTYNRATLLQETVQSVLSQSYRNIEVIVADDGSTDNTASLVARLRHQVQYLRQDNRGHEGATRNLGLRASRGEFIACVDSDDLWEGNKLEKQVQLLTEKPELGMVYSDARCFGGATDSTSYYYHELYPLLSGWIGPSLLHQDFIPCPSPLIRRSVLEDVGVFCEDPVLRMRADWDLWLRIAARYQIGLVPEPLVAYRLHGGSATGDEEPRVAHRSRMRVIANATSFAPQLYGPLRGSASAAVCLHTAFLLVERGRIDEARSFYAQAVAAHPAQFRAYPFLLTTLLPDHAARTLAKAYLWWRARGQPGGRPL